jgi:hypothetical protein
MPIIKPDTLSNFIPLNRKFFDHAFWKENRTYSKSEAWLDLIETARFEESETSAIIDGKMISWTRGQLPASLRYLAERWKWSKTKVNNFIKLLESKQMIARVSVNGQTVISLTNYCRYNGRQQQGQREKPPHNNVTEGENSKKNKRRTGEGHARDKTNNDNKEEDSLYAQKFKAFEEWVLKNTPKVAKMNQPFNIGQYIKLTKKLPKEQVKDLLLGMQNYRPLLEKNDSAYLTIINWAKRDYNQLKALNNAEYLRKREEQAEQVRKRAED